MDDDAFLAYLNKYPALRKRMEELLNVAGALRERLILADDAEGALIENSRHLNREALQVHKSASRIHYIKAVATATHPRDRKRVRA